MTDPNQGQPKPRLRTVGQVYVTLAAAREYAAASRQTHVRALGEEEARRELTELLLDAARITGDTETPERWRYRRTSANIDISARIVREGDLMVVVSITARSYR